MRSNKDSVSVTPQSSTRLLQFDGLRGIAIIIVVLSHCDIMNQGCAANGIFFALTGFLLINPFKDAYEQRFLSVWNILKFYKSRAVRILPAYYIVLLIVFLHTGFNVIKKETFINLLYFGEIHEHLWYVYAYVWLMYVIPFVFLLLLLLAKKIKFLRNDLVCAIIFLVMSALIRVFYLSNEMFDIRFDQLMLGIAAGYFFRYLRKKENIFNSLKKHVLAGQIGMICLFLLFPLSSCDLLKLIDPGLEYYYVGMKLIFTVGFLMSILVLLVAIYPEGFVGRFFQNKALVFLGKHTFTIYLLNSFIIPQFNISNKYLLFICVFTLSLALAVIIDFAIDKVKCVIVNAVKSAKTKKGNV